jgi:hypothetical protein
MTDMSKEAATANLLASFTSLSASRSRRSFVAGALAMGGAVAGAGLLPAAAHAATSASTTSPDDITTIFTVAQTAEQLAVTFYTNGVKNASALGLSTNELNYLKAALIEEQLHQQFFASVTKVPVQTVNSFNFPLGVQNGSTNTTFTDLTTFIKTQQTLEGVFDSAFIAAVYELTLLGRPDLARIACQIAMVESEHRVLGRDILISHNLQAVTDPADNWTYAPQLLDSVGAAPGIVQAAGFIPASGSGAYSYQEVYQYNPSTKMGTDPLNLGLGDVAAKILYQGGPVALAAMN